ncbi:beta strand repeat-containing protein [Hymenobacter rigui]|uniref:T9SS C-terminal target domain-containing protein n=1 Tax=Hymenobacter rigui TaxID=334424 RepID=A0A428KVH2_9BACT|nr:right-handed parallel beta-helix repeat-containing protein [Hymenobacter rigui]RSK50763.1 T9SS C-terminal target domain-containing protein [Hymenobacter rigui]
MPKTLRILAFLLAWILLPMQLVAQNEGTAFSCDGTFYQIRQVGTTSSLFRVNRSAATYTTTAINVTNNGTSNNLGVLLNGLAYNPQDGYLYALSTTGTSGTLPSSIQLYKIGQGGIRNLGTVTGMPNIQVASGTIDKNGNYYVSSQNSTGTADYNIYRFNLAATGTAQLAATALRLYNAGNTATVNLTFYDLALNPTDNLLYAVFQNGTLWRVDAVSTAGRALVNPIKATATNADPVGTSFFDVAGNLFVYTNGTVGTANSGGFYQVNLTNGAYTLISNIDPASVSDGASCINPDQRIDVVKEVTNISRVNATTFDVAFAIRVKNTSTATDANVQINDFLWSGTANTVRANTTFSSVTNQSINSLTFQAAPVITADPTNSNPVFNLAINPSYTGVGGAAGTVTGALLTGTQSLTAGQAATITFTVRVNYSAAGNIPAGVTNTAYASSTTTANSTGYAQNTAGFISAPGQLVATDRSTDGPSLPTVANDDTPTPTPIYFSPSISGTVFEDINYGGGVGRTQIASGGIGVEGVRVELYSNTGAFLTFTTTDAAGNYAFSTTNGTTALNANTQYQVRVVNSTVGSNRPGYTAAAGLAGVQTYIYGATTQNQIGGANPLRVDVQANNGTVNGTNGQSITQLRATNALGGEIQSLVTVRTPASNNSTSPALLGVDFGFNFSTVVNTNDTGAGSLRQFILNSNTLTNENLSQKSSVSGVTLLDGYEYAIFMMNDGTTNNNGLRGGIANAPSGYNAATGFTFTPATALPNITDESMAIDGTLQAALTGNKVAASTTVGGETTGPEVTINFNSLKGLYVTGASSRIASVNLTGARGSVTTTGTPTFSDGAGVTIDGAAAAGTVVTDITALNNASGGIRLQGGATDVIVSNNVLRSNVTTTNGTTIYDAAGISLVGASNNTISGNTLSSNRGFGMVLTNTDNTGNTVSNNTIISNGSGASSDDAGISIQNGSGNTFSSNTVNNNTGDGIVAASGSSTNLFTQNSFSTNGDLGIDLSAPAANANGDGASPNASGKTTTSGANGLLNFPIITQATVNNTTNGNLILSGYAPAGSTIELFVADRTTAAFGQGKTFITSLMEGGTMNSVADADAKTSSYSNMTVSGLNQGSETNASRFYFTIPFANLSPTQRAALTGTDIRLTATATLNSTTSEFSGNIVVQQNRPLPVTLTSFTAQATGQYVVLKWATAQEVNNDHFVVERSFNGQSFEPVQQVKGQGTKSTGTAYAVTDAKVATKATRGTAYYRLRQVDTDGTEALSTVQTVSFSATAAVANVYPSPATSQQDARLDLTAAAPGTYQVLVTDLMGRTIRTFQQAGGTEQPLRVSSLPAGIYIIQVTGNGQAFNQRLVME